MRAGRGGALELGAVLTCTVLAQGGLNLARPVLSYRTIALGGGGLAVGLVTAAYALLSLAVALPLGRYTDRSGRTAGVLLAGTALLAVGPVALAVAGDVVAVAVAATTLGLGHVVYMIGAQGWVAANSPEDQLDRRFGWFTASVSLGQLTGPLLGGLVLGDASGADLVGPTTTAALVAALVSALGLPAALVLLRGGHRHARSPAEDADGVVGVGAMLRRPGMRAGLFSSLALLGAVDLLAAYLPLLAEERDIAPSVVGALLALRAGASIASRLGLGALAQRWSRRTLVVTSSLGAAVALVVVATPGVGAAVMAPALLIGGFLLGIGQPLTMTIVVRAVPDRARGAALAVRLWANRAGQVGLPTVAGITAAGLGASGALWFAAIILLTSAGAARAGGGASAARR